MHKYQFNLIFSLIIVVSQTFCLDKVAKNPVVDSKIDETIRDQISEHFNQHVVPNMQKAFLGREDSFENDIAITIDGNSYIITYRINYCYKRFNNSSADGYFKITDSCGKQTRAIALDTHIGYKAIVDEHALKNNLIDSVTKKIKQDIDNKKYTQYLNNKKEIKNAQKEKEKTQDTNKAEKQINLTKTIFQIEESNNNPRLEKKEEKIVNTKSHIPKSKPNIYFLKTTNLKMILRHLFSTAKCIALSADSAHKKYKNSLSPSEKAFEKYNNPCIEENWS